MKAKEKLTLSAKEVEDINLKKISLWFKQMGKYHRQHGHFPDCNPDKCECHKFFLSVD